MVSKNDSPRSFFHLYKFRSFLLSFLYSLKGNQSFSRSIRLMVGEGLSLVFFQNFFLYRGRDTFRLLSSTFKGKWNAYINSWVVGALFGWIITCLQLKLLSTCISLFLKFRLCLSQFNPKGSKVNGPRLTFFFFNFFCFVLFCFFFFQNLKRCIKPDGDW